MSYKPDDQFTGEAGPWLKMFQNARHILLLLTKSFALGSLFA